MVFDLVRQHPRLYKPLLPAPCFTAVLIKLHYIHTLLLYTKLPSRNSFQASTTRDHLGDGFILASIMIDKVTQASEAGRRL